MNTTTPAIDVNKTRAEIIELAKEAGLTIMVPAEDDLPAVWHGACTADLERFAALAVARALPQQVEAGSIDSDEFRGRIIACATALMAGTEAEGNAECAEFIAYIDASKATPASAEGMTDDQVYDLVAKHEMKPRSRTSIVRFTAIGVLSFARAILAQQGADDHE